MADYSALFVPPLLKAMHNSRTVVGTGVLGTERSRYLQILELLALISMVLKVIQDLHPDLATDAAFAQRLGLALDTGPGGAKDWPGWVMLQIPPEDLAMYGATETDSPAVLKAKIDAYNGSH